MPTRKPPAATKKELIEEAVTDQNDLSTEYLGAAEGQSLIYTAIVNAMADVEAITKVKQGTVSYKFRSIDDVMNALHPILTKHKIFAVPFIETIQNNMFEQDRFGSGPQSNTVIGKRNLFQAILTCYFRFYTVDGSYVECKVAAESSDYSDKATQQALSYCFKAAMLQTFCIPTVDNQDGDQTLNELSGTKKTPTASKTSNLPSIADRPPVSQIGKAPALTLAPAPAPTESVAEAVAESVEVKDEKPNEAAISFLELMRPAAWDTLNNVLMPFSMNEAQFIDWCKATLIGNGIPVPEPTIWWLEKAAGRKLYEVAVASAKTGQLLYATPEGFQL